MSIQSEIGRISTNINNALQALAEKGVTIPENANSDNLSELISGIVVNAGNALDELLEGSITELVSDASEVITYGCYSQKKLISATLPKATIINDYGFNMCIALTSINAPSVEEIGTYAFQNCSALEAADFPLLTSVDTYAFSNCTSILSIDIPRLTSTSSNAFRNCSALTSINAPLLATIASYTFGYCSALEAIDLPSASSIAANAFYNCKKLNVIILRSKTVCKLSGTSAFTGTPFANGGTGGVVYVPQSLLASYQTATNWATLYGYGTCTFVAIEGSEYE